MMVSFLLFSLAEYIALVLLSTWCVHWLLIIATKTVSSIKSVVRLL